ncbi:MAG: hypothetical protein ACL93V_17085 [Candidatus Electrothrix sp. YB6]
MGTTLMSKAGEPGANQPLHPTFGEEQNSGVRIRLPFSDPLYIHIRQRNENYPFYLITNKLNAIPRKHPEQERILDVDTLTFPKNRKEKRATLTK